MAFVVEDGTGLVNANSFTSISFADDYFTDRGETRWTEEACDEEKQVALILATDYLDLKYQYLGISKVPEIQALSWPREGVVSRSNFTVVDSDSVPVGIQRAAAEIALIALDQDIFPNVLKNAPEILSQTKSARGLSIASSFKEVVDSSPVLRKALAYIRDLRASNELLRS